MGCVNSKQKKKFKNICEFPNEILLKIFGYLDLHEQFRMRRVNKHFSRVSERALSETEALQFEENPDRIWATNPDARDAMMRPVSLRKMLELCSKRLACVHFTGHRMVDSVRMFSEFKFPNLVGIHLTHVHIDDETFGRLIEKCRNLKKFEWRLKYDFESAQYAPIFPNKVREKLETLLITFFVKQETVKSMIGRFPNLKHLSLRIAPRVEISLNVANDFFSSCPSIETLELWMTIELQIPLGNSFWRLPLRKLAWLGYAIVFSGNNNSDTFVHRVTASFPRLETLKIERRLTSDGIGAMAILHELVEIELFTAFPIYNAVDDGLCRLVAGCPKIQTLKLGTRIEPSTLVKLVNECKKLRLLYVYNVNITTDTEEAAVEVVSQFNGSGENVTIMMYSPWIWLGQQVRAVLDELKKNTTLQIKFEAFEH